VRNLYSSASKHAPKGGPQMILPPLEPETLWVKYRDAPCQHGKRDGECLQCEAEQRQGMAIMSEPAEENE
jgi:hypothetical protein